MGTLPPGVADINRMIGRCLQGFEKHRKKQCFVKTFQINTIVRDGVKNVFAESVRNLRRTGGSTPKIRKLFSAKQNLGCTPFYGQIP